VNCAVICMKDGREGQVSPAVLRVKTAQFSQFFCQICRQTVKSISLIEGVYGP
jgi:hypothetical protein